LPNGQTIQGGGNISTANFSYPGSALNWTLAGPVFPASATITCSGAANGNPCSIFGVARNFSTPYVGMWTLTVQHAFSSRVSLEVAYVGNHGDDLSGVLDINQINPQSPGENTPTCQHCEAIADRPYGAEYPYLAFINDLRNAYISNYHGLQASFTGRNFHNLSFVAGYTYAHALGDFDTSNLNATPQNSRNIAAQYGNSNFDIRHRFTLTTTWDIPGKKTPGQILEGWQINSIVTLQTGAPWAVADNSQDISKTGELEDVWDFFGNPGDFTSGPTPTPFFVGSGNPATGQETSNSACNAQAEKMGANLQASLATFGCYAKGKSIMIPPAIGTFGTMRRNIFLDSGFRNWDLSVFKSFKFKERFTAQFRAEFFNVLNHPNFANPAVNGEADPSAPGPGGFGCGCATPDAAATNPVLGSGGARDIQLGLKLIF
jgi:hypothetical protein